MNFKLHTSFIIHLSYSLHPLVHAKVCSSCQTVNIPSPFLPRKERYQHLKDINIRGDFKMYFLKPRLSRRFRNRTWHLRLIIWVIASGACLSGRKAIRVCLCCYIIRVSLLPLHFPCYASHSPPSFTGYFERWWWNRDEK